VNGVSSEGAKQQVLVEFNSNANNKNVLEQEANKETSEESKEYIYKKLEMTKEIEQNFDIMKCLRLSSIEEVKFKEFNLPHPKTRRTSDKSLILDLDSTLIYTINPLLNYSAMDICCDKAETIFIRNNKNLDKVCVKVMIRPYAKELLKGLSKIYEIIVLLFDY
jgi:TFIIF-interacting CTD phosphatase-like protein